MTEWRVPRVLLTTFLLASGVLTWFSMSGGVIFWDPLPYYATPGSFYLIGFSLVAAITILIAAVLSPRLPSGKITLVADGAFITSCYVLLLGPIATPPELYPWFTFPLLFFGAATCLELANLTIMVLGHHCMTNDDDARRLAGAIVAGTMLGFSVSFLNLAGLPWSTNIMAFIMPAFLAVVAVMDCFAPNQEPRPALQAPGKGRLATTMFFTTLGAGAGAAMVMFGLDHAFRVAFPSILMVDMALAGTVFTATAASIILILATRGKSMTRIGSLRISIVVKLFMLVFLGVLPLTLSITIDEYVTTVGGSLHLIAFAGYATWAWWELASWTAIAVLQASQGRNDTGRHGVPPVFAVAPFTGVIACLSLLIVDINHFTDGPVVALALTLIVVPGLLVDAFASQHRLSLAPAVAGARGTGIEHGGNST